MLPTAVRSRSRATRCGRFSGSIRSASRSSSRRVRSPPIASGLKIGYRKGNKLAGLYDRGDWLVRFDTIGPALGLVPDGGGRPVIQQIMVKHGIPEGTVRIKSRIETYEDLGEGQGVCATLSDGTKAYADVLVGADGVWSQIRKNLHGLGDGAGGFAASGAAGGALDDAEARKLARDTVKIAAQADRRYSGFTCYATCEAQGFEHRGHPTKSCSARRSTLCRPMAAASGSSGSLIREPAGVDPEPPENRRRSSTGCGKSFQTLGDADGSIWDRVALELIAPPTSPTSARSYDGAPLLATLDRSDSGARGQKVRLRCAATRHTP